MKNVQVILNTVLTILIVLTILYITKTADGEYLAQTSIPVSVDDGPGTLRYIKGVVRYKDIAGQGPMGCEVTVDGRDFFVEDTSNCGERGAPVFIQYLRRPRPWFVRGLEDDEYWFAERLVRESDTL